MIASYKKGKSKTTSKTNILSLRNIYILQIHIEQICMIDSMNTYVGSALFKTFFQVSSMPNDSPVLNEQSLFLSSYLHLVFQLKWIDFQKSKGNCWSCVNGFDFSFWLDTHFTLPPPIPSLFPFFNFCSQRQKI